MNRCRKRKTYFLSLSLNNLSHLDKTVTLLSFGAIVLALGCGRFETARAVDGSAPNAACTVPATNRKPPFDVVFRFRADGNAPVYVHKGCGGLDYGVTSCASGFREPLGPLFTCGACECDVPSCQPPTCGACYPDEGTEIAGGTSLDQPWTAISAALDWKMNGQCLRSRTLPPAKYRVAVRAYANAEDAQRGVGGWTVTQDFDLPSVGDVVDVPLGTARPEVCDQDPDASAPVCTGAEARDERCNLSQKIDFAWEGGSALSFDSSSMAPPALFVSDRLFGTGQMSLHCMAPVPRCSADARVVTTADLTSALAAPSVASAFGADMPIFGEDERPVDGSILVIRRPDGKSIGVGGPCQSGSSLCARPLTDDLHALLDLFSRLQTELTSRYCPSFARP